MTYLKIEPDKRFSPLCSSCHKPVKNIHSIRKRSVRDMPMARSQVTISYQYRTVFCSTCGFRDEYHDFINPHSRVTKRFASYIYQLCQLMTIKDVADHHILSWHQVRRIDKIRAEEFKNADDALKKFMKRSRFLLLKNPENLSKDEKPRLKQILKNNELIVSAYILKEYLKRLWQYKYQKSAVRFLNYWCFLANETKCVHLIRFAKTLKKYSYGIINHCKYQIHTGKLEGLNNKKVIKRKAYGFHDIEYFSLKIIKATTN